MKQEHIEIILEALYDYAEWLDIEENKDKLEQIDNTINYIEDTQNDT